MTPMMKPMPTTCMAMSLEMPNRLQAMGISSREPPATPEAPQAARVETKLSSRAVGKSTDTPTVLAAARVRTEMVIPYGLAILQQIAAFAGAESSAMEEVYGWYEAIVGPHRKFRFSDYAIFSKAEFIKFYSQ